MLKYEDMSPGQQALGRALVLLPRHPDDPDIPFRFDWMMQMIAGVPDSVLEAVAAEIQVQTEIAEEAAYLPANEPGITCQPSWLELKRMIATALFMHDLIAMTLAPGASRPARAGVDANPRRVRSAEISPV